MWHYLPKSFFAQRRKVSPPLESLLSRIDVVRFQVWRDWERCCGQVLLYQLLAEARVAPPFDWSLTPPTPKTHGLYNVVFVVHFARFIFLPPLGQDTFQLAWITHDDQSYISSSLTTIIETCWQSSEKLVDNHHRNLLTIIIETCGQSS